MLIKNLKSGLVAQHQKIDFLLISYRKRQWETRGKSMVLGGRGGESPALNQSVNFGQSYREVR